MNKIKAKVIKIKKSDSLHHSFLSSKVGKLSLVTLDVNFKVNQEILLGFKPTAVAVAKDLRGNLSYSNQIEVLIKDIDFGEILTKITAISNSQILFSIITTTSAKRLQLVVGQKAIFLVKATDVFVVDNG